MNAFFLLCPFLIIRFVLLSVLNGKAIRRAAYFAPLQGGERIAYCIYQISNIAVFLSLFFLTVKIDFTWFFIWNSAVTLPDCACVRQLS